MTVRPKVTWGGGPGGCWPELFLFTGVLGLAWGLEWRTTDLVWGVWFSGLVSGSLVLALGALAPAPRWGRGVAVARSLYYLGLLVLSHAMLLVPLRVLFPQEELRQGVWAIGFWWHLARQGWLMILAVVVFERAALWRARIEWDVAGPFLPYLRTLCLVMVITPLAIFGSAKNGAGVDSMWGYGIAALFYFSPWRIGREAERS